MGVVLAGAAAAGSVAVFFALGFGESSPDAVGLVDVEGVFAALGLYRAGGADFLGCVVPVTAG